MTDKIMLEVFTDPMMSLSCEHEPVLEQLRNLYKIEIKYIMAGLVKDVSDFMTAEELALTAKEGIQKYNNRLAQIYLREESIGGLPMHMEGFHLFDEEHRSSYPLCIAYKAAEISDPLKADRYLYNLRLATIVETRQTTASEELIHIADNTGINIDRFLQEMHDGSAEKAFQKDLEYTASLGIHSLPAYDLHYQGHAILIHGLPDREKFIRIIDQLVFFWVNHFTKKQVYIKKSVN